MPLCSITRPKLGGQLVSLAVLACCVLSISGQEAGRDPSRPWLRHLRSSRGQPAISGSSSTTTTTSTTTTSTSTTSRPLVEAQAKPQSQPQAFQQPKQLQEQQQQQVGRQLLPKASVASATGSVFELPAERVSVHGSQLPVVAAAAVSSNRSTRTADIFQNGDGFNIFVTTACERESMKVNIQTSKPFYGVIHTRDQRLKPSCSVEGNGDKEYNLEISQILNQADPSYCGAIRARRDSPDDRDTISVVLAVRVHRTIEVSDDKFFLLNCTNRCRKSDCSTPNAKLQLENPSSTDPSSLDSGSTIAGGGGGGGEREESPNSGGKEVANKQKGDECTIYQFPWAIALLWCLGILSLALLISQCIMCSSLVCKCVKTEVEEREPSIYEGATDSCDEDKIYNKRNPYRIDYDNRDIYKTGNNYQAYTEQTDELDDASDLQTSKPKRNSSAKHRRSNNRNPKAGTQATTREAAMFM